MPGISRSSPAASAATGSCTAPQSETTAPSKPHSSRRTSVSSHWFCGGVHAVDPVVGAHHRPRAGLGHDPLEGGQVDLAQRALVDVGADRIRSCFLVVGREVLHRRADALALQAPDAGGAEHAGQQRVLGVVLEVAPAQRRPLDVDPGPSATCTPSARASRPTAAPTSPATSGSQLDPTATAAGKQVAGIASCSPRWPNRPACRRTPCGPSVRTIDGTPAASIGWVDQKSRPESSAAFCSRDRRSRTLVWPGVGRRHRCAPGGGRRLRVPQRSGIPRSRLGRSMPPSTSRILPVM